MEDPRLPAEDEGSIPSVCAIRPIRSMQSGERRSQSLGCSATNTRHSDAFPRWNINRKEFQKSPRPVVVEGLINS
jgi:hypothetical protein